MGSVDADAIWSKIESVPLGRWRRMVASATAPR